MERPGATTLKGNPLTLVGPELKAGDDAPDFTSVGQRTEARHPEGHRQRRPHHQRRSVARYAGLRRADQAVQRGGGQPARRGQSHRQHGPAVRPEALVRRFRRGQGQDALRPQGWLLRLELRNSDQGTANRKQGDLRRRREQQDSCMPSTSRKWPISRTTKPLWLPRGRRA